MADDFNINGGREVSPGPRGFSVDGVEVSPDGTVAYFTTDQPGTLNGIPLPVGPRGPRGLYGDPGEARIRADESVGFRLYLWDTATAGEHMVYGDTGTWTLPGGTNWVRRVNNTVETNNTTAAADIPGFAPQRSGATGHYITDDQWPTEVNGTMTTPPNTQRGLEGYSAAVAQGYPGTAEEWMNMVYRVILPPAGSTGQVLTRTAEGSDWLDLPRIGPGPWVNITLTSNWKASTNQVAQVRNNNGTVEMIGDVTYIGPPATAGIWEVDFIRIGTIPPAYAPSAIYEVPVRSFRGLVGSANTRIVMVLQINLQGQVFLGAFDNTGEVTVPMLSGHVKVNLGAIPSYALRNS